MNTHNLPQQLTPFIGRGQELTEIARRLHDSNCRLLTLLGSGGIGKTRLALQAAAHLAPHFADGVYFVPLAPVATPDLIADAIAGALNISFFSSDDPRMQIVHYLREKHLLLVIDNFEHLLEGVDLLTDILQSAPEVKILATSRERLNVLEEWVFALDGLSFPSGQSADALESYSAVQLFVQRARQLQPNFSLEPNAEAVQTICQYVEGMPLGLELAATWLRVMSAREIAAQITGNINFLTTPHRNVPERHRSLRAVFDQSWNLLSADEQAALMKLSVFRGGFDRESAEQVAGATLPILAGLVDKSLIRLNAAGRYDLHELLRQYAADKLLEAGEANVIVQRHLAYFLQLAEQADAHQFGREQVYWFDRLEIEQDNLRAALSWSMESEAGLRLAASLGWFFSERAHWIEGMGWLEKMLAANPDAPALLRAKALHSAGALAGHLGNTEQLLAFCGDALTLARSVNDRWSIAWSLSHLGLHLHIQENRDHSMTMLEEGVNLFRELEDPMGLSHGLIRCAMTALPHGKYAYVQTLLDEAAIIANDAGDKVISGWAIFLQGHICWLQDHNLPQAKSHFETSLSLFREAHFQTGVELPLSLMAAAEHVLGDDEHAQAHFEEALLIERKNMYPIAHSLLGLATIAMARRQFVRAACLLGAADSDFIHILAQRYPEIITYEREVAAVRNQLGEVAFAEAWAAGKAMTEERAAVYALEGRTTPIEPAPTGNALPAAPPQKPTNQLLDEPLSVREFEVLRLIADGLSNAEIAAKLYLSVGTVKVHTRSIYGKLGVNSRTQAVVQAQNLNLL